jgi:hypothetical protein
MSAPKDPIELKDEILADLAWRFVERVREQDAAGTPVTFTHAELVQFAGTLELAAGMPAALDTPEDAVGRATVRDKVEAATLRAPQPAPVRMPARAPRRPARATWLGALGGALAAIVLAATTVNSWHTPRQVVREIPVPYVGSNVEMLDESKAQVLIPQMVSNKLSTQDEKNLMWHMLLCPGCFHQYEVLKHGDSRADGGSQTAAHPATQHQLHLASQDW